MQTNFTLAQLADPNIAVSEQILRGCVHCGFCLATCPTYTLLGDECDSPRGRIYLIKELLESGQPAGADFTTHIDRCLSCLSCMTTCPSGVHYMHLVDHARGYIERTRVRPWADRHFRRILCSILPFPSRFRLALRGARLLRRPALVLLDYLTAADKSAAALTEAGLAARLEALMRLVPTKPPASEPLGAPGCYPATGTRHGRVALLTGCAQPVLAPRINAATIRLLNRLGIEVVVPPDMGCCGALSHHMGQEDAALAAARINVAAWSREMDDGGLDAIIMNTSGCGTTVKDYGFMLREDEEWRAKAERVSGLTRDISEYLLEIGPLPASRIADAPLLAYHSACSLQHGQKLREAPVALLRQAGFEVRELAEGHLCCGSAGTYNILQPGLAEALKARKLAAIKKSGASIVASGNIGCMTQLSSDDSLTFVHSVQLLDWATGGEPPEALQKT